MVSKDLGKYLCRNPCILCLKIVCPILTTPYHCALCWHGEVDCHCKHATTSPLMVKMWCSVSMDMRLTRLSSTKCMLGYKIPKVLCFITCSVHVSFFQFSHHRWVCLTPLFEYLVCTLLFIFCFFPPTCTQLSGPVLVLLYPKYCLNWEGGWALPFVLGVF